MGLLLGVLLIAQSGLSAWALEDDLQLWLPVTLEVPVKKFRLSVEVQPRISENVTHLALVRVRPSVTYDVNTHLSLTAGYLWSPIFPTDDAGDSSVQFEQRVWQQAMINHAVKKVRFNHQFRLEQRFIEDQAEVSVRGRYLIRALVPLRKGPWSWVASNELLMNLNDTPHIDSGFNQERVFTGFRRTFKNKSFVEAGYMLQFVDVASPGRNQLNHNLVVRLNVPLDLTRTQGQQAAPPPGLYRLPHERNAPLILD